MTLFEIADERGFETDECERTDFLDQLSSSKVTSQILRPKSLDHK